MKKQIFYKLPLLIVIAVLFYVIFSSGSGDYYYAVVQGTSELRYLGRYKTEADFQRQAQQFVSTSASAVIVARQRLSNVRVDWVR